ncbi:gamma-glutamyltransferase [Francisella tularensis]|uniref:Glutathione hydrolase proenzyme n=3 Tax=Francisella tularensis TaxID=263 RepID=Q5NFP8_FRATT|nr:gamma-glutamyltransferase [Francisella tularensis]AFB79239.1 Gamma-glutamyltranspeptidase [Francisella tularensis subsp. tularensis TIGB03]AFB80784.1 Gamma-glutamyltranspeptidase [Francisella tularensis subsp. tularensis TI0902]AJI69640.1 gamma-glutamyltransferase [Francisella tularensis subsp. tularensis SCHU S4]AJI70352.1 gamma-glutamyltransferase [Francisella tularensis subsp. tularensis]AKZ20193.1 Gamma-glutamyltranspeptidase [Francisella tularensis subsp. tularensis MA00-2987]
MRRFLLSYTYSVFKNTLRLLVKKLFVNLMSLLILLPSLTLIAAPVPTGYGFIPIQEEMQIAQPVTATHGMVSSQEALASKVGLDILKQGGNAVDAAVAVGFALAVTLPRAGNLAGGGFMIIHLQDGNKNIAINYREKAPAKASRDMFLNDKGDIDYAKVSGSYSASGVPGTVAGLIDAQQKYGKLKLSQVIKPAIKLAEDGIPVSYDLHQSLVTAKPWLQKSPDAMKIFYKKDGSAYEVGEILKQPELANSLKLIAKQGKKAFYEGEIAHKIADSMAKNGGLITLQDLKNYNIEEMKTVKGTYRGYTIYSMLPPSSGGVILIELLNILENFPLSDYGNNSAKTINLMSNAMSYAYNDRNSDLGDPDFVKMDLAKFLSKKYAKQIAQKITTDKHIPSKDISTIDPDDHEKLQTTHFSIIDKDGNMVSNTYTLNYSYGSGIVVPGTGIFLNNEMDDFAAKVGEANVFGLVQGEANTVAPNKRPLSSMTPTIVLDKDGKPFLATGSPGGSRIITTTLQVILNIIDFNMNLQAAVNNPRIHSQLWPEEIGVEQGISVDTINLLKKMGNTVTPYAAMGAAESVMSDGQYVYGAADPRRASALAIGY